MMFKTCQAADWFELDGGTEVHVLDVLPNEVKLGLRMQPGSFNRRVGLRRRSGNPFTRSGYFLFAAGRQNLYVLTPKRGQSVELGDGSELSVLDIQRGRAILACRQRLMAAQRLPA
jgi:sRNA-binding carbon storage regulator CsrA